MHIKNHDGSGGSSSLMPPADKVIVHQQVKPKTKYDTFVYRDKPSVRDKNIDKLESKLRSQKPPEGSAGNK